MGLLASIVAYLSVVVAIVIGFLMSADALLYHSHHQTANPRPEITTAAKADALKIKMAVKPSRNAAELRTIPRKSMATEYRRNTKLSNPPPGAPHKRTVRTEAQKRYWALRQEHPAPPRALGYAEEPRFGGYSWR